MYKYTEQILFDEQQNEKEIDDVKGCRKGSNMIQQKTKRSGGLIIFMSCIDFIIGIKPVLRTESPTFVFQSLIKLIYGDPKVGEYFSRGVVVFGWDMMCNMMGRLLGKKFQKLLWPDEGLTPENEVIAIYYLMTVWGMHRLFIDAYHAQFHLKEECKCDMGCFNVKNPKFQLIFEEKNHNVAEQIWVKINKLRNCKLLCSEKFYIAIWLTKELHNNLNKKRLEQRGFTFESIFNFKPKMEISWEKAREWYDNLKKWYNTFKSYSSNQIDSETDMKDKVQKGISNITPSIHIARNETNIQIESRSNDRDKYAKIPKSYDELIKMKSKPIALIERTKSGYENMPLYYNFWMKNKNEKWNINNDLNNFMRCMDKQIHFNSIKVKILSLSKPSMIVDNIKKLKQKQTPLNQNDKYNLKFNLIVLKKIIESEIQNKIKAIQRTSDINRKIIKTIFDDKKYTSWRNNFVKIQLKKILKELIK